MFIFGDGAGRGGGCSPDKTWTMPGHIHCYPEVSQSINTGRSDLPGMSYDMSAI
jgi:hypothetical protein